MTKADRDALRKQLGSAYALHHLPALLEECERLEARNIELEAEVKRLQQQIMGHCDRIAAQSELLSRRAEKEESN